MVATLAGLRESALELRERFVDASRELAEATADMERLRSEIADCTATIEGLYSDRRSVRREERYRYTEQISEEKDCRQALREELNTQRERRRQATSRIRSVRLEAQSSKTFLAGEVRRLGSAAAALPTSSKSRFGSQLDALRHQATASVEACRQLIAFLTSFDEVSIASMSPATFMDLDDDGSDHELENASQLIGDEAAVHDDAASLAGSPPGVETRIEFLAEPTAWLVESSNGLECVDRPNREFLPITGTDQTVLYDSYVVTDSLDTRGLTMEAIGVAYASALLGAEARGAILSLGGPGRPDMLSLDADQTLWITEIKATERGGLGLHETGLLRSLAAPDGGEQRLFENSTPWLQRSGVEVLRSIEAALMRGGGTAEMEALAILRDRYAEAVRSGFSSEAFRSEVVQVGLIAPDADYLLPLTVSRSGIMDRFVDEVRPDRIAQVNVVKGAHAPSVAAEPERPTDDANHSPASDEHSNQPDSASAQPAAETPGDDEPSDDNGADDA